MASRTWITGLTLAGIAGTGGAAFAGMTSDEPALPPVGADAPTPTPGTEHADQHETVTYQIGTVGTVTLEVESDHLEIEGTTVTTGWTLVATSVPGTHVGAQFIDGLQLVTFSADLVNGEVVVNVTNQPAEGVVTTDPMPEVTATIVPPAGTVAPPAPATPPPTTPGSGTASPTTPTAPHTSAPSSGDDDDEDDEDEDHEDEDDEDEDHEDEGDDD